MAELTFNEYLDLVKAQAKSKITMNKDKFFNVLDLAKENAKEVDRKVEASIKNNIYLPLRYKNEQFVEVIQACCEDFSLAAEDMKDPEKFAAILSVLNEKLAKDGDAFAMDTPENKMLGLANRYALSARECQYLEKWSLFAFYMRSLAYFIPQLIHKANMKEEQVLKKIESKLTSISKTQVGLPQSFIGDTELTVEDKLSKVLSEDFDKITDKAKKEQYKEIEEAKKDLEKKSDYELLDMYYHGDIPKGAKANKDELIYGILQDRFGDEVKYFYKEPVSEASIEEDDEYADDMSPCGLTAASEPSYQDLYNELDEKFRIVKNSLDRIEDRYKYRTIQNISYPLDKAIKLQDDLWKSLDKIDKEVNKLWNKIG